MTTRPTATSQPRTTVTSAVLRGLTALGLVGDAVVHLHLAAGYQESAGQGIGAGNLFRIESVFALTAAAYILVRGTRRAYGVALVVAVSAIFAVVLYRYVDVPTLGPIPAMYEPVWFAEKNLSVVAEAIDAIAATAGVLPPRRALGQRGE